MDENNKKLPKEAAEFLGEMSSLIQLFIFLE